jgi:hypothetical protein
VTVYLVWTSHPTGDLAGPWEEARTIADGLTLLDSTESLSAVYHAVKWTLPHDAALIVTPVPHTPKLRGLAPGTTGWLRTRTKQPTAKPRS